MNHAEPDPQEVLGRFNRLMHELSRGRALRNAFEPWEVELLLDIEACGLEPRHAQYILQRYRKAAERQLDYGQLPPLKMSEFLRRNRPGSG